MAYSDPVYNVRNAERVIYDAPVPGTTTASGTSTLTNCYIFPAFFQPTKITGVKVQCVVAPAANVTAPIFTFLNGTSTFAYGTAPIGTGTTAEMTIVPANGTFTNTGVVTTTLVGTTTTTNTVTQGGRPTTILTVIGTASGQSLGTFAVDFEQTEWFNA